MSRASTGRRNARGCPLGGVFPTTLTPNPFRWVRPPPPPPGFEAKKAALIFSPQAVYYLITRVIRYFPKLECDKKAPWVPPKDGQPVFFFRQASSVAPTPPPPLLTTVLRYIVHAKNTTCKKKKTAIFILTRDSKVITPSLRNMSFEDFFDLTRQCLKKEKLVRIYII